MMIKIIFIRNIELRKLIYNFLLLLLITTTIRSAYAGTLNVKPGAWEIIRTTNRSGSVIPPSVLAKMPPEKRLQYEKQTNQS
ncbi:MAG: hypothetical protein LM517_11110, partial [Nitrosomonas sp.]|nr:hypothetical protein [Nitrosomonas sp.]